MEDSGIAMTMDELKEMEQKLLAAGLTDKEKVFLSEVMKSGVRPTEEGDVKGYWFQNVTFNGQPVQPGQIFTFNFTSPKPGTITFYVPNTTYDNINITYTPPS